MELTARRSTSSLLWLFEIALRVVIGGAFIYAGWIKVADPVGFADSVASFSIVPSAMVVPFALALPVFEIAGGILVIAGWPQRIGALALMMLTGLFCVALLVALARGLEVNCGCFGASSTASNPWLDLVRDVAIMAGCLVLYRPPWVILA